MELRNSKYAWLTNRQANLEQLLDVDLTSSVDVVHIYIGNGIGTLTKVGAYALVSISSVNRKGVTYK